MKFSNLMNSLLAILYIMITLLNYGWVLIREVQWFYCTQELLVPAEKFSLSSSLTIGSLLFAGKFDTPKIQSCPKFLVWNSCSKSHISINTWWILTNEGSTEFKLDCVKLKNSYILWIEVINFKLALINFVYFFETPDTVWNALTYLKLTTRYAERKVLKL